MNKNYTKAVNSIFDACDKTIATASGQNAKCTNVSSILTILIQTVGKSVERWASDLFVTWEDVIRDMAIISDGEIGESSIFAFGMREDGVDHSTYLLLRFMEADSERNPSQFDEIRNVYYRHIFALKIEKTENGLLVTLKDIQGDIKPADVIGIENE